MFHLFILQLLVLDSHIPHQRVGTVNDFHVTMYLYMYLNTTSKFLFYPVVVVSRYISAKTTTIHHWGCVSFSELYHSKYNLFW